MTGDSNGHLRIYNSSSSSLFLVNSFYGHSSWIWRIKPSPFNNYVATSSADTTVKIWNSFNWTLVRALPQNSSWVWALEWLDKDTLASASWAEQTIKIWSMATGQTKSTINIPNGQVFSLKLLNNKIHLAAGLYCDINIYNINDGSLVSSLKGHQYYIFDFVQITDDLVASSGGNDLTVRIWNLTTNTCKFTLTGHIGSVLGLKQITPSILASGCTDTSIKLWDITSGQLIRTLTGHTGAIHMSVDLINSQTLVSGSANNADFLSGSGDGEIKLWNWSTGECLSTIQTNTSYIYSLAVVNSVEGN
jgi:WD40 repeat protein